MSEANPLRARKRSEAGSPLAGAGKIGGREGTVSAEWEFTERYARARVRGAKELQAMSILREFAEAHRVRVRRDGCGEAIIPGKPRTASRPEDRSHVYAHGDAQLAVYLSLPTARRFNAAAKRLLTAGAAAKQRAECEGCFLFDAANPTQVKAVLREAGIRTRKVPSSRQNEALARYRGGFRAKFAPEAAGEGLGA